MDKKITAAKAIKSDLAKAFPGVKFSVKTSRGTSCESVRVSYADGPALADVERVANAYKYGNFDGMTDMYVYDYDRNDARPRAEYIFVDRSINPERLASKVASLLADYGLATADEFWSKTCRSVHSVARMEIEEEDAAK